MCGIAGILQYNSSINIHSKLVAMSDTIAHRGPDGSGIWVSDDQSVGFSHRRLAIVDLSAEANQPMTDSEKTTIVTFNGEIYNHLDLRNQLLALGHNFVTDHSDTEVLIHGYKQWGLKALVNRLDGMFAFGLWDNLKKTLVLARDRIGIKPLYFCSHNGSFRFASEIKSILTDPSIPREMDQNALNHYLSFMVSPPPLTQFKGIYKLPAAHTLTVCDDGTLRANRYWELSSNNDEILEISKLPPEEQEFHFVRGVRSRLESAVEKRLMSDVSFGVFLSGGIDSSVNVALMSQMMSRSVDTFTVGFKDFTHLNELNFAKQISNKFKTNHHEILIDEKDVLTYLNELIHYQDEPIADWVCLPLHFLSNLAKRVGRKVVQVGEGSDEQFCGYESWLRYLKAKKYFWDPYKYLCPNGFISAIDKMGIGFAPASRGTASQILEMLHRASTGHELFFSGANSIWEIHKPKYLNYSNYTETQDYNYLEKAGFNTHGLSSQHSGDVINEYCSDYERLFPVSDQLARMAFNETRLRLPELLLMRLDKISMSNSIEGRVPFLDYNLVEYTTNIPQEMKVKNGVKKYLLKKAIADLLPNDIIHREKMGFSAPVSQWLRGEFGQLASETVLNSNIFELGFLQKAYIAERFHEHYSGKADHSLHLWTIFNLVSWFDHWIDNKRSS